jgi:hypothetical protein
MLSATRKSDGQIVTAYLESKRSGPFRCLECNEEVILKTGRTRVNRFTHARLLSGGMFLRYRWTLFIMDQIAIKLTAGVDPQRRAVNITLMFVLVFHKFRPPVG